MPRISAFRGLRYDLGHVGSLSDVIAPPYDVIDGALQDALYEKHAANVIRLILNRPEAGDEGPQTRYARAARFLKNWRSEGVLQTEPDPAVYVYHQVFGHDGAHYTRRGFMCRVALEPFGRGNIFPHEETHAAAKADRLRLITACKANLSQIFSIYPDPENEVQETLEPAIAGVAPIEATDHLGVAHRLWPVTDVRVIAAVRAAIEPKPLFIADGHHRYETACNYRDKLAAEGPIHQRHPANSVLMMCVGMSDPGMIVLPTHRLFRGLPEITSDELIQRLGECFDCQVVGNDTETARSVWEEIETGDDQGTLGLYTAKDGRWVLARVTEAGRRRMAEVASDHSPRWQGLGVSILQSLVIETLLEAADLPKPKYVHLVDELLEAVETNSAGEAPFPLAALVMPASLDDIRAVSRNGERMPAKSTYFYPKLLSGLVINPLE